MLYSSPTSLLPTIVASNQRDHNIASSAREAQIRIKPHEDPAIISYQLANNISSTKHLTPTPKGFFRRLEPPSPPGQHILQEFKNFAVSAATLAELKKFSNNFKLSTPMPSDIASIISKIESKQKEMVDKSMQIAVEVARRKAEAAAAKDLAAEAENQGQDNPQLDHDDINQTTIAQLPITRLWSDIVRNAPSWPQEVARQQVESVASKELAAQTEKQSEDHLRLSHDGNVWSPISILQPDNVNQAPSRTEKTNVLGYVSNTASISIYSSFSGLTRSTKKTQSTTPTSVSGHSNTVHSRKISNPAVGILDSIQEDNEQPPNETQSQTSVPLSADSCHENYEASLVSQTSTTYTPQQRDDVILRFSRAMLKSFRSNSNFSAASDFSRQHALPHLRSAIKTFAESIEADDMGRTEAKARKMVRRLRSEIARNFQEQVLKGDQVAESRRVPLVLIGTGYMSPFEKIHRWGTATPYTAVQDQFQAQMQSKSEGSFSISTRSGSTMGSEDLEPPAQDTAGLYGPSIDPVEVLKHLTTQSAFESLIHTTEQLIERYHSQKMDLIRHRTFLSLRRLTDNQVGASNYACAIFNVDWDLREFLNNNYDDGINQKLDRILAVTGVMDNAQLCSVGQYLEWCWPQYSFQLVKALQKALNGSSGRLRKSHCT